MGLALMTGRQATLPVTQTLSLANQVTSCCGPEGICGYGPDFCGTGCTSKCDATAMCGEYSEDANMPCGMKLCCSATGWCGSKSYLIPPLRLQNKLHADNLQQLRSTATMRILCMALCLARLDTALVLLQANLPVLREAEAPREEPSDTINLGT
jgi:hypothetical protein